MSKCLDCNGTGADAKKTAARNKLESSATGYIRCWTCNGNGLDPVYPSSRLNEKERT